LGQHLKAQASSNALLNFFLSPPSWPFYRCNRILGFKRKQLEFTSRLKSLSFIWRLPCIVGWISTDRKKTTFTFGSIRKHFFVGYSASVFYTRPFARGKRILSFVILRACLVMCLLKHDSWKISYTSSFAFMPETSPVLWALHPVRSVTCSKLI
jgi:hypothetical protein